MKKTKFHCHEILLMFERSKYNWATSQIETSCKFDYAATSDAIEFVKSFLAQEEIFQMPMKTEERGDYKGCSDGDYVSPQNLKKSFLFFSDDFMR